MSHLNINGVDKPLDHIRLNNVRSENLFNATWSSGSIGANGGMIADTNAVRTTAIPCSAEKTYTFVPDIDDCDSIWVNYYGTTNTRERIDTIGGTFTTPQGCEQIRFRVTKSNIGVTPVQQYNAMLNEGSTAKPYEPYLITKEAWEARTRVILHNLTNPLCGIGTYKDTLDLSIGVLTRYIKKLVLTGKENWIHAGVDAGQTPYFRIEYFTSAIPSKVSCTHYISPNESISIFNDVEGVKVQTSSTVNMVLIIRPPEFAVWSVDDFKSFLAAQYSAGTPVVIWYVLATPETETITVPSNLTGIVEGYLTQSSTPSPTSPVYPTANGTPEQGGTYSLDTGAYAIAWGRADTFTGTNSMSARCYGLPIKSWEIDGNSQQDGTPAPDNPITPEFVGERTENLFDVSAFVSLCRKTRCTATVQGTGIAITPSSDDSYIGASYIDGQIIGQTDRLTLIPVQESTTYTLLLSQAPKAYITYVDSGYTAINDNYIRITQTDSPIAYVFTTPTGCSFVLFRLGRNGTSVYTYDNIMLVKGQKALSDFEPYGYKLSVTSAGQTQNVYLGQVQTTRKIKKLVLTGEEDWVSVSTSSDTYYALPITPYLTDRNDLLSTHFFVGDYIGALAIGQIRGSGSPSAFNSITLNYDNGAVGIEDFKQWLSDQYAAGTPVTVWYVLATPTTGIVNEPLAKIGTYVDTLTSEQAGITIPTTDGNNIISVDTTLAPSKMTITGHIRDVWFTQSITGVPPLSFKSNGTPLISWSMKGNTQQTGTPTPDAPIIPEFVGKRTGNLFDTLVYTKSNVYKSGCNVSVSGANITITATAIDPYVGETYSSGRVISTAARGSLIEILPNTTYTIRTRAPKCYVTICDASFVSLFSQKMPITSDYVSFSFTTPNNAKYVLFRFGNQDISAGKSYTFDNVMLIEGSHVLPFEPYGYKLPITCAGQTVPVYLGQVQTTRKVKKLVLDGTETWYKSNTEIADRAYFATQITSDSVVEGKGLCTHFVNTTVYTVTTDSGFRFVSNGGLRIRTPDVATLSLDAFKQWLAAQYAAGMPVTIWYALATPTTGIVNEPLAKIDTYADELYIENTEVNIPTANGENTLTVDTDLQPSEMTITGYIKAIDQ